MSVIPHRPCRIHLGKQIGRNLRDGPSMYGAVYVLDYTSDYSVFFYPPQQSWGDGIILPMCVAVKGWGESSTGADLGRWCLSVCLSVLSANSS